MTAARDGGWTLRYSRRAENSRRAEKDVARLDPPVRRRILNSLAQFAEEPSSATGLQFSRSLRRNRMCLPTLMCGRRPSRTAS